MENGGDGRVSAFGPDQQNAEFDLLETDPEILEGRLAGDLVIVYSVDATEFAEAVWGEAEGGEVGHTGGLDVISIRRRGWRRYEDAGWMRWADMILWRMGKAEERIIHTGSKPCSGGLCGARAE